MHKKFQFDYLEVEIKLSQVNKLTFAEYQMRCKNEKGGQPNPNPSGKK